MSRYHAIATRYDSGFTADYTCDSCGARAKSTATPTGWTESGKSHRCPACPAGGAGSAAYRGMSVAQGADHVMSQLTPDQIAYAADPARGEYRGFAALHDEMDANMLLPFADDPDVLADDDTWADEHAKWTSFANAVMDEVSRRITQGS